MVLTDLMLVETRLERDGLERKRGKPGMPGEERDALERCRKLLDNGQRIYEDADLAARPELRAYAFLTARPILAVVNVGEDDIPKPTAEVLARLRLPVAGIPTFVCCARSEGEIQAMPEAERKEFREMLGVREPVLDIMVREVYQALGSSASSRPARTSAAPGPSAAAPRPPRRCRHPRRLREGLHPRRGRRLRRLHSARQRGRGQEGW
jgi:ribosome-binding ATPase YchF (GTP1/OBG family)